jgi:outer membrane lipoprotein-sorting protein
MEREKERFMRSFGARLVFSSLLALTMFPGRAAIAAGDLKATLAKLDVAAANFRTTAADFEFDSIQTEPVYDKDVQKGVVYYKRGGANFQMGVHITDVNGQNVPKIIICCQNGAVQLYEQKLNQVTRLSKLSQYQSWFMLGFGASGKELEEKWNISDNGPETVNGIRTEKLEMVPKDPAVRKNVPKVTLWMDLERGVSVKQVFDEGEGQQRICLYSNFKMNQNLPADAFTFKTDKKTTFVNR